MIVLSLPRPAALRRESSWRSGHVQREIRAWSRQLSALGIDTDPSRLEQTLRRGTDRYVAVHESISFPFAAYAMLTGSRQGWQMFASPQRFPAEVHVDVWRDSQWQPIYRPHSEYDWNHEQLLHNRFRKFQGRFARRFIARHYNDFCEWIARGVARDFPKAERVRIRLYTYELQTPPAIARGDRARPSEYRHARQFDLESLR